MGIFDQSDFEVRFEWGPHGVVKLGPTSHCVVVVDVLRFTTCVSVAIDRNATVYPFPWKGASLEDFARNVDASVADGSGSKYSLSPSSMLELPEYSRIVLPSPNGSMLSLAAYETGSVVLAGCLRNAQAVAVASEKLGGSVAVIAAGERWDRGNDIRPSAEDAVGAGAIIHYLSSSKSPEAQLAESAFLGASKQLEEFIRETSSGKELISFGYLKDLPLAADLNASKEVPAMREGAFTRLGEAGWEN